MSSIYSASIHKATYEGLVTLEGKQPYVQLPALLDS